MEEYEVVISRKALKGVDKLGKKEKEVLAKLITDLRIPGPVQPSYPQLQLTWWKQISLPLELPLGSLLVFRERTVENRGILCW